MDNENKSWVPSLVKPAEKVGEFLVLTVEASKEGESSIEREFRTTNMEIGEALLTNEIRKWVDDLNKTPEVLAKFEQPGVLDVASPPTPEIETQKVLYFGGIASLRRMSEDAELLGLNTEAFKEFTDLRAAIAELFSPEFYPNHLIN